MMHLVSLTLPLYLLLCSDRVLAVRRTYNLTLQTGTRAPGEFASPRLCVQYL